MNFGLFIKEGFTGSLTSVISMAKVIIPLMIGMEILRDSNILDKVTEKLKPVEKLLDISSDAVFPLIIGFVFGLSYGAGVIIESVEEQNLGKKDLYILMIFLVICHSVIEDTIIFVVVGANLWLLLGVRIGVAIIVSILASKILNKIDFNKDFVEN